MDPTPTLGMDLDPDALDASIDQAVDALFVDRTEAPHVDAPAERDDPGQDYARADPPLSGEDGLLQVKQHLLALDWEISPANIEAFRVSVHDLKEAPGTDGAVCGVLGRMEDLCDFLATVGPEVRPEAVQFLHDATRTLHLMLQADTSPAQRETSAAEVESAFQALGPGGPKGPPEPSQDGPGLRAARASETPGRDQEEEFPLLEPEEVLGIAPVPVMAEAEQSLVEEELLPLLEPEPEVLAEPLPASASWPKPMAAAAPTPDLPPLAQEADSAASADVEHAAPALVEPQADGEVADPENRYSCTEECLPLDVHTKAPQPECACEATVGAEPDERLLAALESSGRLEAELECANQEVGAFFDRILRATEGKPHLERLASSFSNARDAVAQRLAATEEIACDLHAQLARAAQAGLPSPVPEGAPKGGCPLGGDAREIVGAAGQIQEAVAMLQQTLAVLMNQQPHAPAVAEMFSAPIAPVQAHLHQGDLAGAP